MHVISCLTSLVVRSTVSCMTPVQPTITAGEAAERLTAAGVPVSEDTVRRWAKAGRIPAVKLPLGRMRFRVEDIDAIAMPTSGSAA